MTEPKRWIDEGPPEAIEHLLRAAADERPADTSLARALGAVGVGIGTAGAATSAGAATGALSAGVVGKITGTFAVGTFVKWGLLAATVTVAGVAGKVVATRSGARSVPAARASAPAPAAAAPRSLPAIAPSMPLPSSDVTAEAAPPETEMALPSRPTVTMAPRVAPRAGSVLEPPSEARPADTEHLAEEVALVDRARGALARGDARASIAALDEYDSRFRERRFVPEALYLRMESLRRLGNESAARAVAERLAKRFPTSPQAARARQVLESIP